MTQQQRIEYSPALSKFMAEAEAVGGWRLMNTAPCIRLRNGACPLRAIYGIEYRRTAVVRGGLTDDEKAAVMFAADDVLTDPLTAQLREDMIQWTKQ
jgi:hypothetical protein